MLAAVEGGQDQIHRHRAARVVPHVAQREVVHRKRHQQRQRGRGDQGGDRPGGILFARYGKGVFIYTTYVWFRELPAGVPGAYRMFVNLVSAK